jgi:hypothetical protein
VSILDSTISKERPLTHLFLSRRIVGVIAGMMRSDKLLEFCVWNVSGYEDAVFNESDEKTQSWTDSV